MKIEWNKVTWYSKLLAAVLFIVVFCVGYNLGKKAEQVEQLSLPPQDSSTPKLINTVFYKCDGSKTILAKYYEGINTPGDATHPPIPGGNVELKLSDGRNVALYQTISADGGRYANSNESFIFWSKGDGAFVMEGKSNNTTYNNCVESN